MYKQVVSRITGVRLVNSGTGGTCNLLDRTLTFDIANLTDRAQYAALAKCTSGKYNRIDVEFQRAVHLMDQLDATSDCSYVSYTHENGTQRLLNCDSATGICTLSIQGGSRGASFLVQEDLYNDLGIDFDLKMFTVTDFGVPATCAVNMKVAAVSAADMNSSGRAHGITGSIQGLDTGKETFSLLAGGTTLTVSYAGINPALQPNIDVLLQTAVNKGFTVSVLAGEIDLTTGTVPANRIYLNAAGAATAVLGAPKWTFDLAAGTSKAIAGSFKPPADVQGAFTDGAWVNVKFDGYDAAKSVYTAAAVEVLPDGIVLDD